MKDVDLLPEVARRKWAFVTQDARIRYRPAEKDAWLHAGLRVFVVVTANLGAEATVAVFEKARKRNGGRRGEGARAVHLQNRQGRGTQARGRLSSQSLGRFGRHYFAQGTSSILSRSAVVAGLARAHIFREAEDVSFAMCGAL